MLKVLIVDDSKFQRLALSEMMKRLEYEVVGEAENGEIGFEMYKDLKPDLVTMDINMPILDGLSAVKKIISDFPDAVIFMISSHTDRSLVMEAIEESAVDFVNKPIDEETFKKKIRHAFKL